VSGAAPAAFGGGPPGPGLSDDHRRRIRLAARCPEVPALPRVPGAGEVFVEGGVRCQRMHNGVRVVEDGYCGRWMTELIRELRGYHEPQEEAVFHQLLPRVREGGTMVELGGYWGYYSLWFQRVVANARTYLVEPDPGHLRVGRQNFALNGAEGRFTEAAVGRLSGPPAPFPCDSDGQVRQVARVSLDDFLAREGIGSVDVLLADIQGFELEMLEGASGALDRGAIRFLVLSTHHHSISGDPLTHQKCLRLLEGRGARIITDHGVAESYTGDGLIVAALRAEDASLPVVEVSHNRASESLFREVEYDLADAWTQIAELRRVAQWPPVRLARAVLRRARRLSHQRSGP
jgi:FkbM family methyltransferase